MDRTTLKISINDRIYLRDPQETELGKRLLTEGLLLINEMGMEKFTFKKLAIQIGSTEASMYRYFENKNKLLMYFISWFWVLVDYRIQVLILSVNDPVEKLKLALRVLCEKEKSAMRTFLDAGDLHKLVLAEASKSFFTKEVDESNRIGYYREYAKLCERIRLLILDVNPEYPFAETLASTLIETAHQQTFYAMHLQNVTNIRVDGTGPSTEEFLTHMLFQLLKK